MIVEATLDPSWLFPAGAIEEEEAGPRLVPDLELVSFFLLPQRKGTARPEAGESQPMDAAHIIVEYHCAVCKKAFELDVEDAMGYSAAKPWRSGPLARSPARLKPRLLCPAREPNELARAMDEPSRAAFYARQQPARHPAQVPTLS